MFSNIQFYARLKIYEIVGAFVKFSELAIKRSVVDYATTLYRLGTSKDKIGEILGHSNSRVTEHYFGSIGVESVETINKLLPRRKS